MTGAALTIVISAHADGETRPW